MNIAFAEDYFENDEGLSVNEVGSKFEQSFMSLIEGKNLEREELDKLVNLLHKPLGRKLFAETMDAITNPVCLNSMESFEAMLKLVTNFLYGFKNEKDNYNKALETIMEKSKYISVKVNIHTLID